MNVLFSNSHKRPTSTAYPSALATASDGEAYIQIKKYHEVFRSSDGYDKIAWNSAKWQNAEEKLGLFITVDSFLSGFLLFGFSGQRGSIETHQEKLVVEFQLLAFCLFFGAILTSSLFLLLSRFHKWDKYYPYHDALTRIQATTTEDQAESYFRYALDEEDERRDDYRKRALIIPSIITCASIVALFLVVFWGAAVQFQHVGDDGKEEANDLELGLWIIITGPAVAVLPALYAARMIYVYTGRLYY